MRKRILLVAAKLGYQTRAFAEAGARLGFDVQLATDRCHVLENPWGDDAIALDFVDPVAPPGIGAFDGIVAVGDAPAEAASRVAAQLGLKFHPPDATRAAGNKFLARQQFAADPLLLVPAFERVPIADAASGSYVPVQFPCVVKPLQLSASRGVIRANNGEEFRAAVERIRRIVRGGGDEVVQVEEFIPGREYAVEGMMTEGELRVFAIFDKPDPLDGPFFEETIYVTPSRSGIDEQLEDAARRAAKALGLFHGPIHAEMRVNSRGVWVLEVAARPIGGLCASVLRTASGQSWEEVILRHAAGVVGDGEEQVREDAEAAAVMMIPIPQRGVYRGVSGVQEALQVPGVERIEITAKEGQEMLPLPEGASYLGFIFARAATADQAESALRQAHTRLRFDLATALPLAY